MKKFVLGTLLVFLLLAGVVFVRTVLMKSKQVAVDAPAENIALPPQAAEHLAGAIRIKTVSYSDPAQIDNSQLLALHAFLERAFPEVHQHLTREAVNNYSLLYTWKGQDASLPPIILTSHMDVVPVEPETESKWHHPPFSGDIADGFIWGRGTLDDKSQLIANLEAVEYLLKQGFTPRRTIYLAFGQDEEIGGAAGAVQIAKLLQSRGVHAGFLLDEGGAILHGIISGIEGPVAIVSTAEKGFVSVELRADAPGGHSSTPPRHTNIGRISEAVARLEQHPMHASLQEPVRSMLLCIGPEMPFLERAAVANLWLLEPLVVRSFEDAPVTAASVRTTTAPTIFRAGNKDNVLPNVATAVVNFRILPGDTVETVLNHVRDTINDPEVKVTTYGETPSEPSPISDINTADGNVLQKTIRQIQPNVLVTPALTVGGTDARHYATVAGNLYRASVTELGPEDVERIHGIDERIPLKSFEQEIRFRVQLIKNLEP